MRGRAAPLPENGREAGQNATAWSQNATLPPAEGAITLSHMHTTSMGAKQVLEGFRAWVDERRAEWRALMGYPPEATLDYSDHRAFDAWLRTRAAAGPAAPALAEAIES